jgi:hypothetical protein
MQIGGKGIENLLLNKVLMFLEKKMGPKRNLSMSCDLIIG